jgi:LysR family transcriptional regulator, benzoate and cis,cis-muconate-responsive activator of ben and cat genes
MLLASALLLVMLISMELRQLRYFMTVAEEGSISRAAAKIFLTQPALSRQIKSLEEALGQRLLDRQAHSIRLTPAGQTFLQEARELLRHAELVIERVRASGSGLRLRVGYAPSLATGILSVAVEAFTHKHPAARVEMFDLSTNEMRAGLESDELDLAVSIGMTRNARGLKWNPLLITPWHLAVNDHHRLWRRASVTPSEIASEPLLVFCQRDYPEYWDIIITWLRKHRTRPRIAGEYDGIHSLLAAVESGLGVGIVTARAAKLIPGRVRLRTLSDGPNPLCIAAGFRAERASDKPLGVLIEELRLAANSIT